MWSRQTQGRVRGGAGLRGESQRGGAGLRGESQRGGAGL